MKKATFGSLIRSLREQNKMTQAALADKLGVTDKAVSKWERDISFPDVSLFPKLADLLGVTSDDLFRGCSESDQPSRLLQIFEMSNDIRTPLNIMLGYVYLAEAQADDKGMLMHYLEGIRISGEYLLQSVDHAMQTTYKDRNTFPSKRYPADLVELSEYLKSRTSDPPVKNLSNVYDFSGKRILVAEDIELNREIAGELLSRTGAEAEFAEDGEVCLHMLKEAPAGYYDVILMDLKMPNMDGIETTLKIRGLEDEARASIPIIAVTDGAYEVDHEAAYDAGIDDFVENTVFIEKLFSTIGKHIKE